ncbi:hypothetical protein [Granulicella rosea]|nr:hypothetical protein [Granulicella rosea]
MKETRPARPWVTEPVVDAAHRIRGRMRDLRESQSGYADREESPRVQESKFLLFRGALPSLPMREGETRDRLAVWFVLGAWFTLFAFIGVVLATAILIKGRA